MPRAPGISTSSSSRSAAFAAVMRLSRYSRAMSPISGSSAAWASSTRISRARSSAPRRESPAAGARRSRYTWWRRSAGIAEICARLRRPLSHQQRWPEAGDQRVLTPPKPPDELVCRPDVLRVVSRRPFVAGQAQRPGEIQGLAVPRPRSVCDAHPGSARGRPTAGRPRRRARSSRPREAAGPLLPSRDTRPARRASARHAPPEAPESLPETRPGATASVP